MSPRTPFSIALGTAVTVALFGLMESMVRPPEEGYTPPPPSQDLNAWVPRVLDTPPPPTKRRIEPKPEQVQRPTGGNPERIRIEPPTSTDEPTLPQFRISPKDIGPPSRKDPRNPGHGDGDGDGEGGPRCWDGEPATRLMVTPDYPRERRMAGQEGEVEVELVVGRDGRVISARVVSATPRGAFDAATLRAVKRWTFEPQGAGCAESQTVVRENVRFRLEGVEE